MNPTENDWLVREPAPDVFDRMFSTVDQVLVRDMIGVGLIDVSHLAFLEPELAARVQALLDDPDG